jgi:hypothetical protein
MMTYFGLSDVPKFKAALRPPRSLAILISRNDLMESANPAQAFMGNVRHATQRSMAAMCFLMLMVRSPKLESQVSK